MQNHAAKFVAKPGCRDQLVGLLSGMFAEVGNEPGTLLYLMHESCSNPDEIWFVEVYRDAEAFAIHSASETHDHVIANFGDLVAEPPAVISFRLVAGKGI